MTAPAYTSDAERDRSRQSPKTVTLDMARDMRSLREAGATHLELAELFTVAKSTVQRVLWRLDHEPGYEELLADGAQRLEIDPDALHMASLAGRRFPVAFLKPARRIYPSRAA